MRYLAKAFLIGVSTLLVSALAQAQPPGGGATVIIQAGPPGEAMQLPNHTGINWDDRNFIDPICGVTIIWPRSTPPYSFYNNSRNLWGPPVMIPFPSPPLSPVMWILNFGGPNGPCFSKSDKRLYQDEDTSKQFLGLHFGFYTDVLYGEFVNFPCWWIGANRQAVPCSGIAGYNIQDRFLAISNAQASDAAVLNVAVAFSPEAIPVDDLHRVQLPDLEWRSIALDHDILPAAEGDLPGTLTLEIPADLLQQRGFAVFSYDIADPETREVLSNVTFEIPIPEE